MTNKYTEELLTHIKNEGDLEDLIMQQRRSIVHIAKRLLIEKGCNGVIEGHFKETLYKVLSSIPFGNIVLLILGKVDPDIFANWVCSEASTISDLSSKRALVLPDDKWVKEVSKSVEELKAEYRSSTGGELVLTKEETKPTSELEELKEKLRVSEKSTKFLKEEYEKSKEALVRESEQKKEAEKKLKEAREKSFAIVEAHKKEKEKALEDSVTVAATHNDPKGSFKMVPAADVFPSMAHALSGVTLPKWTWEDEHGEEVRHGYVPKVDPNYIFREKELKRVLYALTGNKRMYIHGHTGSGKTTLVEQVAAHLNWPFICINFDSEITRMDLIGRDTLVTEGGKTVSKFVDSVLPMAMSGPYIACFDELDFVRPDVAYVMQRAFEGNGMRITEDGGRMVTPHPMFRMFATGNTVGQGDEKGMYQGARPQSLALLDRFTVWLHVDYMDADNRKKLIENFCPTLTEAYVDCIGSYVTEHLTAFLDLKVLQPISPRGILAIAKACEDFTFTDKKSTLKDNLSEALEMVVLDRASEEDRAVLKGLVDRVVKV